MLDADSLGRPGRAGSVDDVGQVPAGSRRRARLRIPLGAVGPAGRVAIQIQDGGGRRVARERPLGGVMGEQDGRRAIFEQVGEAVVRVGGVQRDVSAARLQHRQ